MTPPQRRPRRSRRRAAGAFGLALGTAAGTGFAAALAPGGIGYTGIGGGPLVQVIDAQDTDDHTDISIQFACSVFYIGNAPASHGSSTRITLRLGTDCGLQAGALPPELPVVGGGSALVKGARLDALVPGQVTLELDFGRELDFVMAPSSSGTGMRVRLLTPKARKPSVLLAEPQTAVGYSVNLDSSKSAFDRDAVAAAASTFGTQAYVSEADVEGEHWYRLRLGPFATRADAQRVLDAALARYPRAWLAAGDEQTDLALVEHGAAPALAAATPSDPPLAEAARATLYTEARAALDAHRYPDAIERLTRLKRQPEYPGRAQAEELLGLARERAGQLAQAKAEYEEYLARYPDGAGATRVRARLQALIAASLEPNSAGTFGAATPARWSMAGSASVSYQYGKDQTVSAGTTTTTNTLSTALVFGDLLLRERGARYDMTARVDAGYTQNLSSSIPGGTQDRTTAAYVEIADKNLGLTGRVGRQSLASQGIVGLFDGLFVGYSPSPTWTVSGAAGVPAYSGYSSVTANERFGTISAEFDPFHQKWIFDTYVFDQMAGGLTERRSVGLQTRYTEAGRTAVALVDYDIAFHALNSATLIGNLKLGSWVMGFDADHRKSPILELSNALIGTSSIDVGALQSQYQLTAEQLRALAVARTAESNTLVLSASRAIGERWQFMVDAGVLELSGTPATPADPATQFPAIPATLSTGLDKNGSLQMTGSSLLQTGDLHIVSVRFDDSPQSRSIAYAWDARFVIHGAWRFGPRFSVEQLNDPSLGGRQTIYLPQLRGDWTGKRQVFELIAGYQLLNQITLQQPVGTIAPAQVAAVDQRSLYLNVAYRVRF